MQNRDGDFVTDETTETELRVRRGLNNIYLRQLSKISLVMFIYYTFISISHFFVLEDKGREIILASSIITALAGAAVNILIGLEKISADNCQIAFVPAGLSAIMAVFTHVFFTGDQLQLTNGALIMFAIAFATLSPAIFTTLFVISSLFYCAALVYVPGTNTLHFAFMYIAIAALTIMCFFLRYRTQYSSERLLIANRSKASKLVEASRRIQENIEEVRASAAEAKRASEAKDVFLANTTHELRTPLTGVLGMMDYLSDTDLSPDQKQAVDAAQFSARTLLVVVNDLLDIAKLDAGKLEIKSEPFMPGAVVARVVELLQTKAQAKGLELSVHGLKRADTALVGDPVRIGQVILNFTDNAIKFTDEGEVAVAIKLQANEPGSGLEGYINLRITVQDSGAGISDEDQERLFMRFEQLDGSAARTAEGAGLGLSICHGIANQMGGKVSVDSKMGMGSTFTFEVNLPVADAVGAEAAAERTHSDNFLRPVLSAASTSSSGSALEPVPSNQDGLKVLLAEDNAVNQLLMKKIAAKFGWDLTVVGDGQAAVFKIEDSDPFDIILMDIRMPRMDGVHAAQRIKNMPPEKAAIPIIALTANTGAENETLYRQQGMSAIVGKPIDTAVLKETVESLLVPSKQG